ncbi:MAG TPA: transcriptional repressor [Clostridiales bacterium]|jgi:Fur family ferric uptake transcriptional regulator|nr:transcriptional repressor [Clostridiales bacterium]HOL79087.1 transcriptional repressor [Clostridiales bacterium]HPP68668.1 transcriptional repressor [Clostridiales bacterium]HPU66780.1 transcriptional repressor [Clostridiales bacterium]
MESSIKWPENFKRTKAREAILSVLENSPEPLSAADIYSKIDSQGEDVWLSTIYRTLEQLVDRGVALKARILPGGKALYELNRESHKHYAVCLACNKVIHLEECPIENLNLSIDDSGFKVTGHNLEVFGYCVDCKDKDKEK